MSAVPVDGAGAVGRVVAKAKPLPVVAKHNFISRNTFVFMIIASVSSLRAAPTMAVYGLASVFLYAVPAVVFLVPQTLVSAELASAWPGGIYRWVTEALGPKLGLLAIWCQYAMTIFYYPALLAYVASTFAYVIDPSLASNGLYTAIVIISVYWAAVIVSGRGMKAVAWLSSAGAIIGTIIPGIVLVGLGVAYLAGGHTSAAPMRVHNLLPAWAGIASLVLIVNNFLSYTGMEMNAVHVSELKDPKREFPKVMFLSIGIVLAVFILPALAVSSIVPASAMSLTAGVMQAFTAFFGQFGLAFLVPVVALAIIAAMLGGMLTWLAGPSTGLLLIGREEGFIPPYFQKLNKQGMQMNIMVWQGVVTSIIACLYAFIPAVSNAYWIFEVMTTQIYLIVYLLMFVTAVKLRREQPERPRGYRVPALTLMCTMGFLSTIAAFFIGFVPPSQFSSISTLVYVLIVAGGVGIVGPGIPLLLDWLSKPHWKTFESSRGGEAFESSAQKTDSRCPSSRHALSRWANTRCPSAMPTSMRPAAARNHRRAGHRARDRRRRHLYAADEQRHRQEQSPTAGEVLRKEGLPVPSSLEVLTNALGTNGGAVCKGSGYNLTDAILDRQLTPGGGVTSASPLPLEKEVLNGQLATIEVYCPSRAAAFIKHFHKYKLYDLNKK